MKQKTSIVPLSKIKVNGRIRKPDTEKVKEIAESIRQVGLINPLTLSSDLYLIAGGHRLAALKLLGRHKVPSRVLPFSYHSLEAGLFELDENLARNELTILEQSEYLLRRSKLLEKLAQSSEDPEALKNQNSVTTNLLNLHDVGEAIGLSARSVKRRLSIAQNLSKKQRDMLRKSHLANEQKELLEIARIKDSERRTGVIKLLLGKNPPKTVRDAVRNYRIDNGEISAELDVIKPSTWWSFGQPKWLQEGFRGSIPGEIYANALYYFAPSKGIAADGMAGSGMLKRIYDDRELWQKDRRFNLKIKLYDLYPREPFSSNYGITCHDMTQPLEEKVDWLFIDPPYFRIASTLYEGELAKSNDYKVYLGLMRKVIDAAKQSLKPNGTFCLFTTAYININDPDGKPLDVPKDLLDIAIKKKFVPHYRIYVSRGEQQRRGGGMLNIKAKAIQKPFSDVCELLVFRNGSDT